MAALEWCSIRVGSSLTRTRWTRLERLARNKHSSLLRAFVIYGLKSFVTLGPDDKNSKFWLLRHLEK